MTVNDGDEPRAAPAPLRLRPVPTRRTIGGLLPLVLALLLLAGCGGEDTEEPLPGDLIPEADLSTAAGAREAFTRAFEETSVSLMHDLMLESDRPQHMKFIRDQFQALSAQGVKFRVAFDQETVVESNNRAELVAKYFVTPPGREEFQTQKAYDVFWEHVVFVKSEGGEWKFSPGESRLRSNEARKQREAEDGPQDPPEEPEGEPDSAPEGDPVPEAENGE